MYSRMYCAKEMPRMIGLNSSSAQKVFPRLFCGMKTARPNTLICGIGLSELSGMTTAKTFGLQIFRCRRFSMTRKEHSLLRVLTPKRTISQRIAPLLTDSDSVSTASCSQTRHFNSIRKSECESDAGNVFFNYFLNKRFLREPRS